MARVALIGATGLVGRTLAPLLVADGHQLLILTRRPAGVSGAREVVAQMDAWPAALADEAVDIAISALGTTWRKSGSWERFAAVDRFAVTAFARAARDSGARQMVSVSSVGADPASRIAYLALKGTVEADLAALGFARLDIVRPGLLRGERGPDRRTGERIGIALSPLVNPLLVGRLRRYRAIDAALVAAAIASLCERKEEGRFVYFNDSITRLASR